MYLFLWCKAEFSAAITQAFMSHDLSEIILYADLVLQKHYLLLLIKDAPKRKFLAEVKQNETLGRRPTTKHGF